MANRTLGVESLSLSVLPRHREVLDRYADTYGYPGRSPALRRLLDTHPELKRYYEELEEPAPCPTPP